jgi:hypothetical protein
MIYRRASDTSVGLPPFLLLKTVYLTPRNIDRHAWDFYHIHHCGQTWLAIRNRARLIITNSLPILHSFFSQSLYAIEANIEMKMINQGFGGQQTV